MANLSWDEVGTSVHDYGNTPVGAPTPDQTLVPPDEWSGIGTPVTEYGQEAPKPEISTTEDVLKSTGSGLARGIYNANQMVNSIPGPGDALNWAGRKISHAAGWTELEKMLQENQDHKNDPFPEDKYHKPETTLGEYGYAAGKGVGGTLPIALVGGPAAAAASVIPSAVGGMSGQAAKDLGAGTTGQTIAEIGGSLVGGVPQAALSKGINALRGATTAGTAAEDLAQAGVKPYLPTVASDSKLAGAVESVAENVPGSFGRVPSQAGKQVQAIGEAVEGEAGKLAPKASNIEVGATLRAGGQRALESWETNMGKRFANVDRNFTPADRYVPDNFTKQLDNLTGKTSEIPETSKVLSGDFISKLQGGLAKDLEGGGQGVTWDTLRQLRTRIGNRLKDNLVHDDAPSAELKSLYKAISDDMTAAAATKGPGVVNLYSKANKFASDGYDYLENTMGNILKKGKTPEQVYSYATSGVRGSQLADLRKAYTPEEWGVLSSNVLRKLGNTTDGFSPKQFFQKWSDMDEGVKGALFPDGREALDRLSRISKRAIAGEKLSGKDAGAWDAIQRVIGYGTLGTAVVPGYLAARILTNPTFLRIATSPGSSGVKQALLGEAANRSDDIKEFLSEVKQ